MKREWEREKVAALISSKIFIPAFCGSLITVSDLVVIVVAIASSSLACFAKVQSSVRSKYLWESRIYKENQIVAILIVFRFVLSIVL